MAKQLTADDAKQSLCAHVESKGAEIFLKYGPLLGWAELQRLLEDRVYVRYPVEIVFDASRLLAGELAHAEGKTDQPEDGFAMIVHPAYEAQPDMVPVLVMYQLVAVNYGEFASSDEAECFGAAALGLTRDEYYNLLCELADELFGAAPAPAGESGGCGGGCNCGG
jgi:hypothetical protein